MPETAPDTPAAARSHPRVPLVQYWHSDSIPPEISGFTESFRRHNPDMNYRMFDEAEADRFISEHLGIREVTAFRSCAVPAMQSDYFRICAVLVLGGVYSDVALICRRPLRTLIEPMRGGVLVRMTPASWLSNAFLAFSAPGHPFLRLVLDVITANIERRVAERVNLVTGPWAITCLETLWRAESIEAARRWSSEDALNRLTVNIAEAIDDFDRVRIAFEGIEIISLRDAVQWLDRPPATPVYKASPTRWNQWPGSGGSIFR